jgi:hypothetical protein
MWRGQKRGLSIPKHAARLFIHITTFKAGVQKILKESARPTP